MTRPGKPGRSRPLFSSVYGGSIDIPEGEEPLDCCDPGPRPDRALNSSAFTVTSPADTPGAAGSDVQQTALSLVESAGHTSIATDWDTTPTDGNTLFLVCTMYSPVVENDIEVPAGWTDRGHWYGGTVAMRVATKVASSEGPTVTVTHVLGGTSALLIGEIDGAFGGLAQGIGSGVPSLPFSSISPTDGAEVGIVAVAVSRLSYDVATPPAGYTQLEDDEDGTSLRVVAYENHVDPASGAYSGSVSYVHWISGATVHMWFSGTVETPATWTVPAPFTVDGDDSTYHEIDGPDVLRVDLGTAFRIVRARVLLGSEFAGTVTYLIRGSNNADFTGAVELGSETFVVAGSFTPDELNITWSTIESYQYFELSGTDETRRIFSVEMYEPSLSAGEDHDHDSAAALTVEEVDGSPTDDAITKIVFPNGTLGITAHVATYTPAGGGAGGGGRGEDGSKYNPDHETPTTTPAIAEEFNGSHGMAWTSAPATNDVTTYPGSLRFKGASAERYLTRAWTPGASDITIACKVSCSFSGATWGSFGIEVGSATGNPADGVYVILQPDTGSVCSVSLFNRNASSFSSVIAATVGERTKAAYDSLYLRLTRAISGPVWTAYFSVDGITWYNLGTTGSKSLTVGAVGIRLDASTSDWRLDWIRAWTSIVEKVGA